MQVEPSMVVPNTLSLPAKAAMGCCARSVEDVQAAQIRARHEGLPFLAIGRGSNIVPAADVQQFICLIRLPGIDVIEEDATRVRLRVAAGEDWHGLVQRCLGQGWFGLENLALIPGLTGAAPVQNIGAYGVELAPLVVSVDVLEANGDKVVFSPTQCAFGYRNSVFKARPDLTILGMTLDLSKTANVVVEYPDLSAELDSNGVAHPTPEDVAVAVIAIRRRKLPDPDLVPNAGSFFKNPLVPLGIAQRLVQQYPHLKTFDLGGDVKLSAAQLIDQAGWKDTPKTGVACWQHQPLVLVNTGHASSADVMSFANAIIQDVLDKFGVQLELEPSPLY